jgi:D-amino acid aminotransferase
MNYLDGTVFLDGRFIRADRARVSVFDRGLLYGDGLFETMRAYRGSVFALDEHLSRLRESANVLGIALPERDWRRTLAELLRRNDLRARDAWVRLNLTRGPAAPDILPPTGVTPTVFALVKPVAFGFSEVQRKGARVTLLPYSRHSFMPEHKTLNYLPTILGKAAAARRGAYEGLFVRDGRYLMEGTSSSVFIVRGTVLQTPPVAGILPGVTRRIIQQLAEGEGMRVVEKATPIGALKKADEVFLTSSVAEVVPVTRLDDTPIAGGTPGPITLLFQRKYRAFARRAAAADHRR